MANRDIQLYAPNGAMIMREICESVSSPKETDSEGKRVLRANPHYLYRTTRVEATPPHPYYGDLAKPVNGIYSMPLSSDAVMQKAYSSFNKKIHSGDASLGVTAASWRGSHQMIAKRLKDATSFMKRIKTPQQARLMMLNLKLYARGEASVAAKDLAGVHLEWIFGWVPLFGDITSAMEVLANPVPPVWVTGRGQEFVHEVFKTDWGYRNENEYHFLRRASYSGLVRVINPNLWIANRLGLLNPATVIWDIVPWSFVVGMFVNVNQVLKSFTDHLGLEYSEFSRTNSVKGYLTVDVLPDWRNSPGLKFHTKITFAEKRRVLQDGPTRPPLVYRVPKLDLDLVLMASALAVQQSTRILKLLR